MSEGRVEFQVREGKVRLDKVLAGRVPDQRHSG
jgi:hypothetical protein